MINKILTHPVSISALVLVSIVSYSYFFLLLRISVPSNIANKESILLENIMIGKSKFKGSEILRADSKVHKQLSSSDLNENRHELSADNLQESCETYNNETESIYYDRILLNYGNSDHLYSNSSEYIEKQIKQITLKFYIDICYLQFTQIKEFLQKVVEAINLHAQLLYLNYKFIPEIHLSNNPNGCSNKLRKTQFSVDQVNIKLLNILENGTANYNPENNLIIGDYTIFSGNTLFHEIMHAILPSDDSLSDIKSPNNLMDETPSGNSIRLNLEQVLVANKLNPAFKNETLVPLFNEVEESEFDLLSSSDNTLSYNYFNENSIPFVDFNVTESIESDTRIRFENLKDEVGAMISMGLQPICTRATPTFTFDFDVMNDSVESFIKAIIDKNILNYYVNNKEMIEFKYNLLYKNKKSKKNVIDRKTLINNELYCLVLTRRKIILKTLEKNLKRSDISKKQKEQLQKLSSQLRK